MADGRADGVAVTAGGGGDGPVLLLLHGLGGTAAVWEGLAARWPGRWLAPDLPGHGASAPLRGYGFAALAEAVTPAVAAAVGPGDRLVVLGHSLGGVVGLALAGGPLGPRVDLVVGLGVKVAWSEDDLARAAALAARPAKVFASREEAVDRALAVAGLRGLVAPQSAAAATGVAPSDGGWRLALDPAAFGVGAPDLPALLAACRAPRVVLARGESDPMVSDADLAALPVERVTLPGLGHSAHVEQPAAVLALLRR